MPSKFYTCKEEPNKGLKIKIKRVDPMSIQSASASFPTPEPPTYFAQTITGSYEELPIQDIETAEQVEGGLNRYKFYLSKKQISEQRQNSAVTRTMYMDGCDYKIPEWDWEVRDSFKGLQVPQNPTLKKVFYLEHHLSPEDTIGLITDLMALTGVGEDAIKKAEETFRNAIWTDQPGTDEEGNSENGVEA